MLADINAVTQLQDERVDNEVVVGWGSIIVTNPSERTSSRARSTQAESFETHSTTTVSA